VRARLLDEALHGRIAALCARGDALAEAAEYLQAIDVHGEALALVPAPIDDWEAATWILAAIGDAHFLRGSFEPARVAFGRAMHGPGAIGNPWLHLRLGQVCYEVGELGRELFEDDDPRYWEFLRSRIRLPGEDVG
jgi:tetratricopeptide (TPR) repeat protein